MPIKEAYYYQIINDKKVQCHLCPHKCTVEEDELGRCKVRKNIHGKLMTLNYAEVTGASFDPIEKKPLYHFHPGKNIFSLGSFGCNFSCDFCQNHHIAQERPETQTLKTSQIIDLVKSRDDNLGVAYTYNEPTVFYEFMYELAKDVKKAGYKNVVVSNGFINEEPLEALIPYIDAFNIDLKAFNDDFYKDICGGELSHVMDTIKRIHGRAHLEITILLIDDENTNENELEEMFKWIASIDPDIPLHLSGYHLAYKMNNPSTKISTLLNAKTAAQKYLNYVYIGNVANENSDTYCKHCGTKIIKRFAYVSKSTLIGSKCPNCFSELPIISE